MPEATQKRASTGEPMGGGLGESIDRWLTAQAELLADIDALTRAWLERRKRGIDAARQAVREMSRCQEPIDMLRVQHEWFRGASERSMEDILGLSDGITSLTRRIAGGVEEVTAIASEPLHSGREEMLKAAGDKPKSPNTAA